MKNTSELNNELNKEKIILQEYIDKRNKLILEEKEIINNKSINENNSYMSLSKYKDLSHKRNEEFMAKNKEIQSIEEKILESSTKISKYEIKLGKKNSKEAKKDYSTLCDRMICEERVRKTWLIGAYLKDYNQLKNNRLMLIGRIEKDSNPNEKLLTILKSEVNTIEDQINDIELSRKETLKTIDILNVNKNGLLDREKTLIKNKR